jgi:hypothetical protein
VKSSDYMAQAKHLETGIDVVVKLLRLPETRLRTIRREGYIEGDEREHEYGIYYEDVRVQLLAAKLSRVGGCYERHRRMFNRCAHIWYTHVRLSVPDQEASMGEVQECGLYLCWPWLRNYVLETFLPHLRSCPHCRSTTKQPYIDAMERAVREYDAMVAPAAGCSLAGTPPVAASASAAAPAPAPAARQHRPEAGDQARSPAPKRRRVAEVEVVHDSECEAAEEEQEELRSLLPSGSSASSPAPAIAARESTLWRLHG